MPPKLSIIIPAFNEEASIKKGNLSQVSRWLQENCPDSELIVVDDGSEDDTLELASKETDRVLYRPHSGKAAAVMAGIKAARGDIVLFTDMDLDTPIEEAAKLLHAIEQGGDIAIGSRGLKRKNAPMHRRILSSGHVLIRKLLFNLEFTDTQCGFKAFKRESALRVLDEMRVYHADSLRPGAGYRVNSGFDLEFLYVARRIGYVIDEIPVEWKYSRGGRVRFFTETFRGLYDIFRIIITYKKR